MEPFRSRLSSAHLISLLALFVALGGTGYAAARINGKNIKSNTISGKKLKNRTLSTRKLSRRAIRSLRGQTGASGADGAPGVRGAPGPSNAYSAFKNDVPNLPNPQTRETIAQLTDLPPGDYTIFAKLYLDSSPGNTESVDCQLETGADFDKAEATLGAGSRVAMALNVVRSFTGPGSAALKCTDNGGFAGANYIKITAIRLGEVRNLPSP